MPVIGWMLDGEIVTFEEAERFAERYGDWRGWTPFALEAMRKQVARIDGLWISPSQALECPRLRILKPVVPYYVNPEYTWAALVGSAVHARILVGEGVELPLSADLDVGDESIPVMGTCDYFRDGVLYDVKVTSRLVSEAKLEHVFQVNVYKWLLEQNGYEVRAARIWYVTPYQRGVKRRLIEAELMPRDEVEAWLREIAEPLVAFRRTGALPPCRCESTQFYYPHPCHVEGAEKHAEEYYAQRVR
jgi:hypothetical protein